ncbi:MAG TPA: 3'-5' exonuclease [Ignavibacteria bacterium]|nr:3'-5' exonuclease [Ignavibacteria bacterium]HMR39904.1 3'-5' exonuclease [Ignavibacteria bacterium]
MLENQDLKNVLVLDIETVPQYASYGELPEDIKEFWIHKMRKSISEGETAEDTYDKAGIYAEFGKIVCISAGAFYKENEKLKFRLKSYYGDDEKIILSEFSDMLNKAYKKEEHTLCGHNSKEFDFPYIARRCLINGIPIPFKLDNAGKKPWDIKLLDTMELWKFGDYKSYTSMNLLASVLGISSPKDDIDGSQVGGVYWKEKNLKRIMEYCQKDVITVAQVLLKFKGMELLSEENIVDAN